jgi:hypothetical protein
MSTLPVLTRFDIQVLKNRSGSDASQVPAAATIQFFRQGATVTSPVFVEYSDPGQEPPATPVDVPVRHVGTIQVTDTLQVDTSTPDLLVVAEVVANPSAPILRVWNWSRPQGISVATGKRLLRKTANAIVYPNPTGPVPQGPAPVSSLATDPATGRAGGYVAAYRFDYTVSGTGLTPRLYADAVGSFLLRG